nr:reverse transcriptase domain-containing protein [Tanacetum cinerariifolium]
MTTTYGPKETWPQSGPRSRLLDYQRGCPENTYTPKLFVEPRDKIKAQWTKPGTGMKRVQEIKAEGKPSSLFDFEEVMNNNHNQEPPPQNNNGPPLMVRPNGQALRTMEELCDDAYRHIDKLLEITQHMKQNGVSDDALHLSLFPYSLTHHAIAWYHRLPRNSIHSFDDMMRKFLLKYFPPSMVTKLWNKITKFEQKPGGTFIQKTPKECYELIENMTAHHNHWDTSTIRDETSRNISSTSTTESPEVVRQLEMMNKNFLEMMRQFQTVKTIDTKCETCGGPHYFTECPSVGGYTQETAYATTGRGNNFNQSATYQAPTHQTQVDFQAYMKVNDVVIKNMQTQMTSLTTSNIELKNMFGQFMKMNTASSSGTGSLPSNTVPNPRADLKAITTRSGVTLAGPSVSPPPSMEVDREPETITDQVLTGSTNNVLPLVVHPSPASTSTSSTPISFSKMPEVTKDTVQPSTENIQPPVAQTQVPIDEHVVSPKPKPTIPYPSGCKHLLDASVYLEKAFFARPHFYEMIFELADQSITRPASVAEVVFVKLGKFHFLTDFVVVDYVVDPRVPLIFGRPFLRTRRALKDVYGEELTIRVDDEAVTFKVGQTSKYSYNDAESINQIDAIDVACEEYVQEGGDFILEEIEACLTSKSIPPGINDTDLDLEGDICLLEELLINNPSLSPLPSKELNVEEIKTVKSSIDEPPELQLKELPFHLECAFLKGTDKLPVDTYDQVIYLCIRKISKYKKFTNNP